jgi:hypothetical protein
MWLPFPLIFHLSVSAIGRPLKAQRDVATARTACRRSATQRIYYYRWLQWSSGKTAENAGLAASAKLPEVARDRTNVPQQDSAIAKAR